LPKACACLHSVLTCEKQQYLQSRLQNIEFFTCENISNHHMKAVTRPMSVMDECVTLLFIIIYQVLYYYYVAFKLVTFLMVSNDDQNR
jgi:hypothetical protein